MNRRDNSRIENKNNICNYNFSELKNNRDNLKNNLKYNSKSIYYNNEKKNNGNIISLSKINNNDGNNYSKQLNVEVKNNLIVNNDKNKLKIKGYCNKEIKNKGNKKLFNTNFNEEQAHFISSCNRKSDTQKKIEIMNLKKNSSTNNSKRNFYFPERSLKSISLNNKNNSNNTTNNIYNNNNTNNKNNNSSSDNNNNSSSNNNDNNNNGKNTAISNDRSNNANKMENINKNNSYLNEIIKSDCKNVFSNIKKLPIYSSNIKSNKKYVHYKYNNNLIEKNYNSCSKEYDNSVNVHNKKVNYLNNALNKKKISNVHNIQKENIRELKINKPSDKKKNYINNVPINKKEDKNCLDIKIDNNYSKIDQPIFLKESFHNLTNRNSSLFVKIDDTSCCNSLSNFSIMKKNNLNVSCNKAIISENYLNEDSNGTNKVYVNQEKIALCNLEDFNVSSKNSNNYEKNNYTTYLEESSSNKETNKTDIINNHNTNINYNKNYDQPYSTGVMISEKLIDNKFATSNDHTPLSEDKNYNKEISITINKCDNNSSFDNSQSNNLSKKRDSSLSINSNFRNSKHEKVKKGLTFQEMRRKSFNTSNINTHISNNLKDKSKDMNEKMNFSKERDENKKKLTAETNKTNELFQNYSLLKKRKLSENKTELPTFNNAYQKKKIIRNNCNISNNNFNTVNQKKIKHDFFLKKNKCINKSINKAISYDKLKYSKENNLNEKKNRKENVINKNNTTKNIKGNFKKDKTILNKSIHNIKKNWTDKKSEHEIINKKVINNIINNNNNNGKQDSQKDKEKKLMDKSENYQLINNNLLKKNFRNEENNKNVDKCVPIRKLFNNSLTHNFKILNNFSESEINKKNLENRNSIIKNKKGLFHLNKNNLSEKKNFCNKKELATSNFLTKNIFSKKIIQPEIKCDTIKNKGKDENKINSQEKNQNSHFMKCNDICIDPLNKEKNKIISIPDDVNQAKCSILCDEFSNLNNNNVNKNNSNNTRELILDNCSNILLEDHKSSEKKNYNTKKINPFLKTNPTKNNSIRDSIIKNNNINKKEEHNINKNSNFQRSYIKKDLSKNVKENENYVENENFVYHANQDIKKKEIDNLENNSNYSKEYYKVNKKNNSNENKKTEEKKVFTNIINKKDQDASLLSTEIEDVILKKKNEQDEKFIKIINNIKESKHDIKNKNMKIGDGLQNLFLIKNGENEVLTEKNSYEIKNENFLKNGTESKKTQKEFNKNLKTYTKYNREENINSVDVHTNVSFSKKKNFQNNIMHESNKKKNSKNYVLHSFSHAKKKINPLNENNKNEIYNNKNINLNIKPYDKINYIQEISSSDLLNENFTYIIKNKNNFYSENKKKNINFLYNNKQDIEKNNENFLNRKSKDKSISEKQLSNMTELSSCKKRKIYNSCFSNFSNDVFSISNDCANNKLSKRKNSDSIDYGIKHENDKKILKYNYFKVDNRKPFINENNINSAIINSFERGLNADNSNRSEDLSENYLSNNSEHILPNKKQIEDFISSVEQICNNKNVLKKENYDQLKNYSIKNEQNLFLDNYYLNSVKNTENPNKLTDFNDSLYHKLNLNFDENNFNNKKKKHRRNSSNSIDSTFSLNNDDIDKHNFNFLINSLISNSEEKEENAISKNNEENLKDKNLFFSNGSNNDLEKTYINSYFSNKIDEEDKNEKFNYYTSKENFFKNMNFNIDKNETEYICNDKKTLKCRPINGNDYDYKGCTTCNDYTSNKDYNSYNDYNKDSNIFSDPTNNNDYNNCNNNIEVIENKLKNMVFEYILSNKLNVAKNASTNKSDRDVLKKNVSKNISEIKINEFEDILKENNMHNNSKSVNKNINFSNDNSNLEKKQKCSCIMCLNSTNNDNNNNINNDSTLTDYYQSDVNNNLKSNCIDDIICDEKKTFNNSEYNFTHIKNLIQNISNLNNEENKKFYDNFISKILNNQYEVDNFKISEHYNDTNNTCECVDNNSMDSISDYNYNNAPNNSSRSSCSNNNTNNINNNSINNNNINVNNNINDQIHSLYMANGLTGHVFKNLENYKLNEKNMYKIENMNKREKKNGDENNNNNNNNSFYYPYSNILKSLNVNNLKNYYELKKSTFSNNSNVNYKVDNINYENNFSDIQKELSLHNYINSGNLLQNSCSDSYVSSTNNLNKEKKTDDRYSPYNNNLYKKTKHNLSSNFCQFKNKNSDDSINLNKSIDDNLKGDIYNCINLNILNENILKINEIEKHHLNEIKKYQLNEEGEEGEEEEDEEKEEEEEGEENVNEYNYSIEKEMKENKLDIIKTKNCSQKKVLSRKDKIANNTSKENKIYAKNNKNRKEDSKEKSAKEFTNNLSKKKNGNGNSRKKENDFNFRESLEFTNELSSKNAKSLTNFLLLDEDNNLFSKRKMMLYKENKEKNKKRRSKGNDSHGEAIFDKNISVKKKKLLNNSKNNIFKKINEKVIDENINLEDIHGEEIISKDVINKNIINGDILVEKINEEEKIIKDFSNENKENSNMEKITENEIIINKGIISKEKIINENTIDDNIVVEKINDGKLISKEIINELIMMKEDLIQPEDCDSNIHIVDINKLNVPDKKELNEITSNKNKLDENLLNNNDLNEEKLTQNYNKHVVEAEKLNSDIPYITDIYKEMHKSPVMPLRIEAFHSLEDQRLIYGKPEWQKFLCPLCDKKYYPPNIYIKNYAHYLKEHWQNRKTLGGYIIFPCKLIHDINEKTDTKINRKVKKKKRVIIDPHYHCPLCLNIYFNDYNLLIDHCRKLHKSSGADPSRTLPSNLVHTPFINNHDYYSKLRRLESEVDIDLSNKDNINTKDYSQNLDIASSKKQNNFKLLDIDSSKKKNKNSRSSKVIFCDDIQVREFDIELSKIEKFGASIGPVFVDDQNEKKGNEKEEKNNKVDEKEKSGDEEKNKNGEKIMKDDNKIITDETNSNNTFENEIIIEKNEIFNEITEVKKINKMEQNCEKKVEKKNSKNEIKKVDKGNEKKNVDKDKESSKEKNNKINKSEVNTKIYEKCVNKILDKEQNENENFHLNNKENILISKKNVQYNLNINNLENNLLKKKLYEKKENTVNSKKINIKNKRLVSENTNGNLILNRITDINKDNIINKEEYNNNEIVELNNNKNKLGYDENNKLMCDDTNKITYDKVQVKQIKNEQVRNGTNKKNNSKHNNNNKVISKLFSIDSMPSSENRDDIFSCVNYRENLEIREQPINEILLENRIQNSKEHLFTTSNSKIGKRIKNNIDDFHKKIISKYKRKIKICAINEQKESNSCYDVKFHENIYMPPDNMAFDFKNEKEKNVLKKVIREKKKAKIVTMKSICRQSTRIKSKNKNKKIKNIKI